MQNSFADAQKQLENPPPALNWSLGLGDDEDSLVICCFDGESFQKSHLGWDRGCWCCGTGGENDLGFS
jgi:hypothetical protein